MAKDTQKTDDAFVTKEELEEVVAEARKAPGKTPREITVLLRQLATMFEAVKLTDTGEIGIGTYFVPLEGQPGIEGMVNAAAAYMNSWVREGWRPWQMATPYMGKYSFDTPEGTTGTIEGQWLTIVWMRPLEE